MIDDFPKEEYIKFNCDEFRHARITINKTGTVFNSEIDIVVIESGKIWKHIASLYNLPSEQEAIDLSVQKLADYFRSIGGHKID